MRIDISAVGLKIVAQMLRPYKSCWKPNQFIHEIAEFPRFDRDMKLDDPKISNKSTRKLWLDTIVRSDRVQVLRQIG